MCDWLFQQVAPYGQQVMGGYSQQQQQQQQAGQQGTPPYFSPPQQTPPGPTQSPYLQPRPPPQQVLAHKHLSHSDPDTHTALFPAWKIKKMAET